MAERKKRGGGKPTVLTADVMETIFKYVSQGCYYETACAAAGVGRQSLYDWLNQAKKADKQNTIYKQFAEGLEKASAEAEIKDVLRIAAASKTQWQASAWRLERRYPDRWGRNDRHQITGDAKITFTTQIGNDGALFRTEDREKKDGNKP